MANQRWKSRATIAPDYHQELSTLLVTVNHIDCALLPNAVIDMSITKIIIVNITTYSTVVTPSSLSSRFKKSRIRSICLTLSEPKKGKGRDWLDTESLGYASRLSSDRDTCMARTELPRGTFVHRILPFFVIGGIWMTFGTPFGMLTAASRSTPTAKPAATKQFRAPFQSELYV